MIGILYALTVGVFVSLQNVFNVRMSERTGFWLTNAWLHGTGFLLSFAIFWLVKDGSLMRIGSMNKVYMFGGFMGVIIVFSAMKAVSSLGPAYAIAIMLTMQLVAAFALESLGWFGVDRIALSANRWIGIGIMIAGVIVFKYK